MQQYTRTARRPRLYLSRFRDLAVSFAMQLTMTACQAPKARGKMCLSRRQRK
ncbi:hypothetical protein BDQ12DRAFT_693014 [Crucibulum laeve]|uniref:Uncharacterized protein n=1 Tax=Crucibulum laeve TaxID=68775 RepID=A0A5C3LGU0_9AGAR|nr:hypothetical protein BDQ12DRAFT_693014 [Crucibulum laeve]